MLFNRKLYFGHQVTPYIIFFIERDGSTYLTSLLSSHSEINAIYERFAVLNQQGVSAEGQLEWAKTFLTRPLLGKYAAVGFKTKLVDILAPERFGDLLQQKQCRIIQMRRMNSVKAVVSKINARRLWEASGNWNLYDENDRQPPVNIPPSEFQKQLEEREAANQSLEEYVSKLQLPTLKLVYEDLLIDRDSALNRVFSFLKVKHEALQAKTLKHTRDNLREVIENFDELRAIYTTTQYGSMFDEVLVDSPASLAT